MNIFISFKILLIICNFLHYYNSLSVSPTIVLIAFDGFRYDYFKRELTPVLDETAKNGSTAKFMLNQFPTITFPNFHSISTGMYPETHGVIGNQIFVKDLNCVSYGYEMFHYNEDIIPLWILNEVGDNKRHSGVMMWPGSQFKYQEKYPTFRVPFDSSVSWKTRVDIVLQWMQNDTTPANLIFMYFEQPDEDGHLYGPQSQEVDQQLRKINSIMKYYFQQLTIYGIREYINTIIISDHGMTSINNETILNLNDYVNPDTYVACGSSPIKQIQPRKGHEKEVYNNFKKAISKLKNFEVYKRKNIPQRWHYKNNRRVVDLLLVAKLHYVFENQSKLKGTHGYDNKKKEMHPIFIANGPLFKQRYTTYPFQNIDIYPLISHVLQLSSPPSHVTPNGTLDNIMQILKGD